MLIIDLTNLNIEKLIVNIVFVKIIIQSLILSWLLQIKNIRRRLVRDDEQRVYYNSFRSSLTLINWEEKYWEFRRTR